MMPKFKHLEIMTILVSVHENRFQFDGLRVYIQLHSKQIKV